MALIKTVRGCTPQLGKNNYLAENATLIGDVVSGNDCSFWFNSVVRADVNQIRMGNRVNVQDGAVIHCTFQKSGTIIGHNVSIGHNALVHGCTIENNVLIGMGSIVMDNAVIGSNSIIAAGAVVLENTIVESGSIYAGIPAKKVKSLSEEQIKKLETLAHNYTLYASWFQDAL